MKNIVVPIDFSDITLKVVNEAVLRAKAFSSRIWLIHVAGDDDLLHSEKLKEIADKIDVDVQPILKEGSITQAILEQAKTCNADLIVLGSHGHTAMYTDMFGSVTKNILKEAECPVLVIPARCSIASKSKKLGKI